MQFAIGSGPHKRIMRFGKVINPDPSIAVPNQRLGDCLRLIDSLILRRQHRFVDPSLVGL